MTATTNRPPLSDRLTSSKVIAVLHAPHVAALAPVEVEAQQAMDSGVQYLVTSTS
jgi:hypothetical protein